MPYRSSPSSALGGTLRSLAMLLLSVALLAACAGPPAAASVARVASATPVLPTPTTALSATPALPTPTLAPSANPAPPTLTPDPTAPPRVGLQVGHWKIEDHPEEQRRLRKFSGAYYGGYDEWELNMLIAEQAKAVLEAAGVVVELLPATVPVGYSADAFVSLHVDGVTGAQATTRRGWKVATPFRASAASEALAAAVGASYPAITGLPDDAQGASYDMRAYYAFAAYRYWHSVAPTTPAVIIECGFMTHPADRKLLFDRPDLIGRGIAEGVLAYLRVNHPADTVLRASSGRTMLRTAGAELPLLDRPDAQSPIQRMLPPNQSLVPMAEREGWLLVFTHGGDWDLGWVRADDVVESGAPFEPPFPCCGE